MTASLVDRIAVVTGSDSGIGQATAVELAHAGADVVVTYLHDVDGANDTGRAIAEPEPGRLSATTARSRCKDRIRRSPFAAKSRSSRADELLLTFTGLDSIEEHGQELRRVGAVD